MIQDKMICLDTLLEIKQILSSASIEPKPLAYEYLRTFSYHISEPDGTSGRLRFWTDVRASAKKIFPTINRQSPCL